MEGQKIIQAVTNLFKGADERDWQLVLSVLADEVFLDYSSMNGVEPSVHTHQQVIDAWADFLPGFDSTNHQLSEFKIQLHGNEADLFCLGKADHYIDDQVWTIYGSYHTKLRKQDGKWLIVCHKLNYDRQTGNTSLPRLAQENVLAAKKQ
ncbi:MAG TPA: nuclear transport factor 2 family protein [Mucilaginibacter sp.]